MKASNSSDLLIKQLDAQLTAERTQISSPNEGWIRTIRKALGMSATQLAKRLSVSKQAVANMERAETEGTLSLTTLHKAADALDCYLKVVLVPKKSISEIVQDQATKTATQIVKQSSHHMTLEAQGTKTSFQRDQIQQVADELIRSHSKKIWDEA
jgi:predicted DNA-binding mobile mystery protein A